MVGDHALAGVKVCILESVTSIIIFIKNMAACDSTTQAAIFFYYASVFAAALPALAILAANSSEESPLNKKVF